MKYKFKNLLGRVCAISMAMVIAVGLVPIGSFADDTSQSVSSSVSSSTIEPEGTKNNPYIISIPEHFDQLREYPDAYFEIANDINMQGVKFEPISQPFTGTLNGNGKTISNLTISGDDAAMFAQIANGGTNQIGVVSNIVFANASTKGTNNAAVVAVENSGIISNVKISSGKIEATKGVAGSIAAVLNGTKAEIKKSGTMADVTGKIAGGLVGEIKAGSLATNFVWSEVTKADETSTVGTVFGKTSLETVTSTDVIYVADSLETAVSGIYVDKNDNETSYTKSGFIAMQVGEIGEIELGQTGTFPVQFSSKPSASMVRYTTSNSGVIKVNSTTGEYEALAEGSAQLRIVLTCGDLSFATRRYTVPVSVKVNAGANSDAQSDNSVSDETSSEESSSESTRQSTSESTSSSQSSEAQSSSSEASSSSSTSSSSSSQQESSSSSDATSSSSEATSNAQSEEQNSNSDSENSQNSEETDDSLPTPTDPPVEDFTPEQIVQGVWVVDGANRSYVLADGTKVTGPQEIEGSYYIFNEEGNVYRFEFYYNGAWYMADNDGALRRNGFFKRQKSTTFYDISGAAKTGWINAPDGKEYYQTVSKTGGSFVVATGVVEIDGKTYLFSDDGVRNTGTGWFGDIHLENGIVSTGRQVIDGKTYIIASNGVPYKGEFVYDGKNYYADETGVVYLDAFRTMADGSLRYYDIDGAAVTGWIDRDDGRYYQSENLVILTGRQTIGTTIYFFGSDGKLSTEDGWAGDYYVVNGEAVTGMQDIGSSTYFFDETTALLVRGVFTYGSAKYHSDETGALYKATIAYEANGTGAYYEADGKAAGEGWVEFNGAQYYQKADATLAVGKHTVDGTTYFFMADGKQQTGTGWAGDYYVENGVVVTGAQDIDGEKYIFADDGAVKKGQFVYENNNYYADETGKLFTNYFYTDSNGGKSFYNENGIAPKGWFEYEGERYYQTEQVKLLIGKYTIDGVDYYFNSNAQLIKAGWYGNVYIIDGVVATGPQTIDGKKYILSDLGIPYKNIFTYNGDRYAANSNGILYTNTFLTSAGVKTYYDVDGKAPIGWITLSNGDRYYQTDKYEILTGPQTIGSQLYFFGSDGKLATEDGWAGDYYVVDGKALVGMQTIEGKTYFFNEETGLVVRGEFEHNGESYCADSTGALYMNAIMYREDKTGTYYDSEGKAPTAQWIDYEENRYYQTEQKILAKGKLTLDGVTYFFMADGKQQTGTGWADVYYIIDGVVATGRHDIDSETYIFNGEGIVQKGSFQHEGVWHYASETGALYKATVASLEDGNLRYLDETGASPLGWIVVSEETTYYQDANAFLLRGKHVIDGTTYYFAEDGKQQTQTGWVDGYYLENGVPVTGKRQIENKWYIFNDDGLVQTGEFVYDGRAYAANSQGELFVNSVYTREDKTMAYFGHEGVASVGWIDTAEGISYYQTATNGKHVLATGFTQIGADIYYFLSNGKLFSGNASGWYLINGQQYYIMSDGRYCPSPTINTVNTLYDAEKKIYSVTIDANISNAAGPHASGSFSFDGGKTWQATNVTTVPSSTGATFASGTILVRDSIGQIARYSQVIYLAPVVIVEGGTGNSNAGSYGIDVSQWNGVIDWAKVKASGIDFAIIRATSANNSGYYEDTRYEANVRGAKAAGLDVGVYIYSYINSYNDVNDEVNFFLNCNGTKNLKASGIVFDYPVYVDYEDSINLSGTDYNMRTDLVRQMMIKLRNAGYYPGFYTYKSFMGNFNVNQLVNEGFDFWYARYPMSPNPPNNPSSELGTKVSIWQYCSDGNTNPAMQPRVDGVYSNGLDLNYVYEDVASRVHKFYGVTGSTSPNAPSGSVGDNLITVYDINTSQVVTDKTSTILAKIVQAEVGGFGNTELYKAQAVAANSYIMYSSSSGSTPSVSLATSVSSAVTSAVNAVSNQIVTYNGTVANAMYGAANSGKTQSSAAMWGTSFPYLQAGIDSPRDTTATVYVNGGTSWYNRSNTISLSRTISNIEKMLPGSTSGRTDYQNWITNPEYDSNGYLTYITVMGTRMRAGKFYDNFWGLYSPNFTMTYNNNGTWTFVTRGNGHCVGMSQWGAYGYATQGWTYSQILAHYYPGTQLTTLG